MLLHTQRHQQVEAGNGRSARAGDHQPHVGDIFLHHAQAIKHRGGTDDRRAVLIVVEHRNIHALAQFLFDVEALRRFDILQIDPTKGRLQRRHHVDQPVGIQLVHFDIKHVDPGEFLKQYPLPLHHWLTRQRADIAQPEHCRTVGDHRHQVGTGGVFIRRQRIGGNLKARRSHAGGVGQRQIALGGERLSRGNLNFSRDRELMKIERTLF